MHAHAQNTAIFSSNRGKNQKLEVLSRFSLWGDNFCLKTCKLIPNQWNFTSATLKDIRFVLFFTTISKITTEIFIKIWRTVDNSDSKVHALHYANEQMIYLYGSHSPFKNFHKSAAQHPVITRTRCR